jgi:hypothetical protein
VTGDLTPQAFNDGALGQTPTNHVLAVSELVLMRSPTDPSPAFCFRVSPVAAPLGADTLIATCETYDLPTATFTHARVQLDWVTFDVQGMLHGPGVAPGTFSFFRAYSATVYGGTDYQPGSGTLHFDSTLYYHDMGWSFPLPQDRGGVTYEDYFGLLRATIPLSTPLVMQHNDPGAHWIRLHVLTHEAYRWHDSSQSGYVGGIWNASVIQNNSEQVTIRGIAGIDVTTSAE